jgi:CRISPR-associated endoribonuclease Cas6
MWLCLFIYWGIYPPKIQSPTQNSESSIVAEENYMRIKLTLRTTQSSSNLPFNYQYPLSAVIYKILSHSSPDYAKFLHNKGYIGPDSKPRKLFTFSRLYFSPKCKPKGNILKVVPNSRATLFISSPMLEDFVQHFVIGLFNNQHIVIAGPASKARLFIEQVETIAEPEFISPCRCKALSPIVLTTAVETTNGLQTYFYRPLDKLLSTAVRESLLHKHETVYGTPPNDTNLVFEIDREYVEKRGDKGVSKLIAIREGFPDETKVKGFIAPFTLTGSTELMRTAWECGLGDKTSMGFGCIGVDTR